MQCTIGQPAGQYAGIAVVVLLLIGLPQLALHRYHGAALTSARDYKVAFFTGGIGDPYFALALRHQAATERHFCVDRPYSGHYFIFVDRDAADQPPSNSSVTFIGKPRQGWPRDSDDRYTWMAEVHTLNSKLKKSGPAPKLEMDFSCMCVFVAAHPPTSAYCGSS